MSTVGIIVNPHAGKDIRRLASAASHTSDAAKIGIVRRAVIGALEAGVDRILMSADRNNLSAQAIAGLDSGDTAIDLLDTPGTGSRHDTIAAATAMWKGEAGAVVVLGGDGTCRDVAAGWPDAPCIAISTGTNNVFPISIDATSAGLAAGHVARGQVELGDVAHQAKRIVVEADGAPGDVALVDLALINTTFVGARAVQDPASIDEVLACIAEPASTGLSSIAGRVMPVDRTDTGGVHVKFGPGGVERRVPLSPGLFSTMQIASAERIDTGHAVHISGPGVLAFDGERDRRLEAGQRVTAHIEHTGPRVIDVAQTLMHATVPFSAAPPSTASSIASATENSTKDHQN